MTCPFHTVFDRLLVYNASFSEMNENSEPVFHHLLQNFRLHFSHKTDVDL